MDPVNTLRNAAEVSRCEGTAPNGNTDGLQGWVIGSKEGRTGGRRGRRLLGGSDDIVKKQSTKGYEQVVIAL